MRELLATVSIVLLGVSCGPAAAPVESSAGAQRSPSITGGSRTPAPPRTGPSAARPDTAVESAAAIVRGLHGQDAARVYARFGEPLRQAVSEAQVRTVVAELEQTLGRLLEVRGLAQSEAPGPLTTVHLAAFFERGSRRYEVTLDSRGTVVGLFVRPFIDEQPEGKGPADDYATKRRYRLPVLGAWHVANGGRSKRENHHVGNPQQWYALDLERRAPNPREATAGFEKNADDPSFGQPVIAPADGVVVTVVDGIPDHEPDHTDRYFIPGNTVVIDHGHAEFSVLGHFRQGSIVVRPGQRVKQAAVLGKVGNSGNSSGPHVHWHLATNADVSRGHGLPIGFAPLTVNGQYSEAPTLTRGDVASNVLAGPAPADRHQ